MPFFQPAYLSPQADFFKLLSELDRAQDNKCVRRQRCERPQQTFTPRFDITEVAQAYDLFGEVPGLEQQDLVIEFSDAQTLVIKGKTARPTFTTPTEAAQPETSDATSVKSHIVTVEDEYDEADSPLATPATAATEPATEASKEKAAETPKPKYWVAERKVGEFARSFTFSQRIEQDEVAASLKNGVLHIVVPKSQKPKKVAVSVD